MEKQWQKKKFEKPAPVLEPGRIPPQNLEAERSFLGAIMIDKEIMLRVADQISADDFYKHAHTHIFESISGLYEKGEPLDILTISSHLDERDLLAKVGGRAYLVELSNSVPTSTHAPQYAAIIRKKAVLRKLLAAGSNITALSFQEEDDVQTTLDQAQQELYSITQAHMTKGFTGIKSVLHGAFDRIDELHREKGTFRGVPSGFTELDSLLSGFQKSDLVILAARPSVGKTSFVLDIARHAATKAKVPIGLFSLEMSKEQLVDRMLCAEAQVDLWKMRTGNLSDRPDSDDFPRIGRAMGVLSDAPIYIDDQPGNNIMQIRTKARRLQAEHGLGMLIIDYLQLMESHRKGGSENRVQEVSEMSRGLKGIARELNIPVIALSQLSRTVESTKPAIPKLSHLRDSGAIEQDADVVMFIYRKAADKNYRTEEIPPDERYLGEIHVAKHRNGPTGVVKLFFDETRASYQNLDKMHASPMAQPSPAPGAPGAPSGPSF